MLNIPSCQTAMIGSLPYPDMETVHEALTRNPLSIPTWPQLPRRSPKEGMLVQYSEGLPGVTIEEENNKIWVQRDDELLNSMSVFFEAVMGETLDPFIISPEYAAGLHGFLDYMKTLPEKVPAVKGQVVGPFTFGLGINDQEGRAVWFDEQYREAVLKGMIKKALWQVSELSLYADKVIIFFDEPILSALGTPAYMGVSDDDVLTALNEMSEEVQAAGAAVGVHCCGNMDWSLLARSSIDIISFDAFSYGEKVGLYPEALNAFLERGGYLAWGIVPTSDSEIVRQASEEVLEKKVGDLITLYTEKGIDRERLLNQMLFTPACGMGNLSADDAEKVLALLKAVGNIRCG